MKVLQINLQHYSSIYCPTNAPHKAGRRYYAGAGTIDKPWHYPGTTRRYKLLYATNTGGATTCYNGSKGGKCCEEEHSEADANAYHQLWGYGHEQKRTDWETQCEILFGILAQPPTVSNVEDIEESVRFLNGAFKHATERTCRVSFRCKISDHHGGLPSLLICDENVGSCLTGKDNGKLDSV
ncbi:hypothetical protein EVAR_72278_1 [Eumeta japonica]|uniref:Uncharacterized protein n=1 Tax=Eumeta variegata TaxID=151549 RepID=A0A4C1TSI4_EUMVA|nr:hypothetical protein EVAR_72278_1 [Eumeta japonica]